MRVWTLVLAVGLLSTLLSAPSGADVPNLVTDADRAAARAAAQEVLKRPEFQQGGAEHVRDTIRRWMLQKLDALAKRLGGSGPAMAVVGKTLAWTVSIAALVLLGISLFRHRRSGLARTLPGLQTLVPRLTSREWAARARAALRSGDAREAIRCGYHAALYRLEEQGVWRVDDARTPREYVSLLPESDARRGALIDLARDFEQTWYGSRPTDGHGLLERLEVLGCPAPSEPTI